MGAGSWDLPFREGQGNSLALCGPRGECRDGRSQGGTGPQAMPAGRKYLCRPDAQCWLLTVSQWAQNMQDRALHQFLTLRPPLSGNFPTRSTPFWENRTLPPGILAIPAPLKESLVLQISLVVWWLRYHLPVQGL